MRAATYTTGFATLTWTGTRTRAAARLARNVALFVAAPFVALAYVLSFPFVGLGMLAWVALRKEPAAG